MRYKTLGGTGLLVSEICLGTMTFGGRGFWTAIGTLDQTVADRVVGRALDAGVNFIDTADVYSEGLSEEITGRAIVNSGRKRSDVVVATKAVGAMGKGPNDRGASRGHIMDAAKASLEAARHRLYRPLPDAQLRSRYADRGDCARARRPRAPGLRSLRRPVELASLDDHESARYRRPVTDWRAR